MNENDEKERAIQSMISSFHSVRDSMSPPKAQVDEASLQLAMDKNKESLKMKLMNRRPINQLVDQGIIPSLKVPPHFYEQRQKLERAKMGDFLKHKIQKRPDRQALIQQHILEDTKIDPSLQDKQRQLKKARLADDLNDRLSHRPGPLELVKGNILQADEKFAQAVKEGQIPFKRTCEGQALRHPLPSFTFEDDSGSDVALSPPQDLLDQSLNSMPSVDSMVLSPYANQDSPSSSLGELRITSGTPPNSIPSPPSSSQSGSLPSNEVVPKENVSVIRRKKSKPKAQPKPRTIKFHEYKGPPSAQKNQVSPSQSETSYELLLQQQQLFLQWQLEWQQKYPHQMILPVTQQSTDQSKSSNLGQNALLEKPPDTPPSPPQNSMKTFEDMKVNSLKAELKKRNLPVSGSKVQLLERLKNHLESTNNGNKLSPEKNLVTETTPMPINVSSIILDTLPTLMAQPDAINSVVTVESPLNSRTSQISVKEEPAIMVYNTLPVQGQLVTSRPSSAAPMDIEINSNCDVMDCTDGANVINDDIVKRQQQKILQLQRELQRSQMQLQQQQWLQQQQQQAQQAQQQALLASHPVPIAPAPPANQTPTSLATSLPHSTNVDKAMEQLQQHIQQKIQQQQLMHQAGKFAPGSAAKSAIVKASLAAHIHNQQANSLRLPLNQQNLAQYTNLKPIVLCQAQTVPTIVEKPRANSLPNGLAQQKLVWSTSVPNFSNVLQKINVRTAEPKFVIQKTPPDYNEAVKPQIKIKQEKSSGSKTRKKSVKSQEVDDVLDVLIKNGELPPSAAQDPVTPTTPETQKGSPGGPPLFPAVGDVKSLESLPIKIEESDATHHSNLQAEQVTPQHDGGGAPNLVFDLNLDLQDLESMDLGVLDRSDAVESVNTTSLQRTENNQQPQFQNIPSTLNGDIDMDVDFSDWLDILTNNNSVSSSNPQRSFNYNSDPLLPSMDSGQDTLDMFSLDNMDFRTPTDTNLLSWE